MITIEIDKNIPEIPADASIRESLVTCLFIGKIPIQYICLTLKLFSPVFYNLFAIFLRRR